MPKVRYERKNLKPETLALIYSANQIIAEYEEEGYSLTLRQLYYQFVARDVIENSERSYKNLGKAISNGRLCGLIDWDAIEDRTRNLVSPVFWDGPWQILRSAASGYSIDKWEGQEYRVEVWVEKEALAGVVARPAELYDVPYFCCRGYVSQSEQWAAGQRLMEYAERGIRPVVIHLGDHDPSGVDMTRDIVDRLQMFMEDYGQELEVRRIALNMSQVEELRPPPNPAKLSDSRAGDYVRRYGNKSWELDALNPRYLNDLIGRTIDEYLDAEKFEARVEQEKMECDKLYEIARDFESREGA